MVLKKLDTMLSQRTINYKKILPVGIIRPITLSQNPTQESQTDAQGILHHTFHTRTRNTLHTERCSTMTTHTSMGTRIYLDFDGVINIFYKTEEHGETIDVDDAILCKDYVDFLQNVDDGTEVVWISHREDDVYHYTDQLGIPRYPYLVFTDHTGSKVSDIIKHYTENPCEEATVHEDSLTSQEIDRLLDEGINVVMYHNALIVELFNGKHKMKEKGRQYSQYFSSTYPLSSAYDDRHDFAWPDVLELIEAIDREYEHGSTISYQKGFMEGMSHCLKLLQNISEGVE